MKDRAKTVILENLPLFAILAGAAVFRAVLVDENYHGPLFASLRLDELQYHEAALAVCSGDFLGSHVSTNAPGYSIFLGLVFMVFGKGLLAPRVLQALLGLASTVVVHRIAGRAFGKGAALVSALVFSLYWPLMIFEQRLLAVSLFVFLNLAGLLAAMRARETDSSWRWLLAGVILAAAALVRPTALVFIIALAAYVLIESFHQGRRRAAPRRLLPVIVVIAALAPFIIHCHRLSGDWLLLQRNGGLNFFIGNNEDSDGTPYVRPGGAWDALRALPIREAQACGDAAQDKFYFDRAFGFYKNHPGKAAALLARKAALMLNQEEAPATFDPDFQRRLFRALDLPLPGFALIMALALPGVLALKPERAGSRVLLIYILAWFAAGVITVVSSRYRAPFTAGLAILSGAGVRRLADSFKFLPGRAQGAMSNVLPWLLLLCGIGLAFPPLEVQHLKAEEYAFLGEAWLDQGELSKAASELDAALIKDEHNSQAMLGMARLEMRRGNREAGTLWLKRAVAADPESSMAHYRLGSVLFLTRRDNERALAELQKAAALSPQWLLGLFALARAERETGREEQAIEHLRRILELRPDFAPATELLSEIETEQKKPSSLKGRQDE